MTDKYTPAFEFEKNTFSLLNTSDFREFLIENKVIVTVVGFVFATNILKLIDSFFDNIILVCSSNTSNNLNNNCKSFVDYIYYFKITIHHYNIYIGKFIISLIKFFLSIIFAFYIARFVNDIIN